MGLTFNNFVGFETDGLEEAIRTNGSPDPQGSTVRTGDFSLECQPTDQYDIDPFETISSSGDDQVVGFAFRCSALPSTVARGFFSARENSGADMVFFLELEADGDITINYNSGTPDQNLAAGISAGSWFFIEVRWQNLASGEVDIHVNGASILSTSGKDLRGAGDFDTYQLEMNGGIPTFYFDDFYCMSGASGVEHFAGDTEAFGYQSGNSTAVPNRDVVPPGVAGADNLSQNQWNDTGDSPAVEESDANVAAYTGGGVLSGAVVFDDANARGHGAGPLGDGNIDGISNILAVKYIHRLKRGNGSGTTHYKGYGNSGQSTNVNGEAVTLSTDYALFFEIRQAGDIDPSLVTPTEYLAMGFGKSSGGREIYCSEMWAFILHRPDKTMPAMTAAKFPDQNYYTGPFGT